MAATKFKKRNLNRFRKVYPYIRREPRYELVSTTEALIEIAAVPFTNQDAVIYVFNEFFPAAPTITAVAVDSSDTSTADVNVYVSGISSTQVTLETSAKFTGTVHLHAIFLGT